MTRAMLVLLLFVGACAAEDQEQTRQMFEAPFETVDTVNQHFLAIAELRKLNDHSVDVGKVPTFTVCYHDVNGGAADFIRTHPTDPMAGEIPEGAQVYECTFPGATEHLCVAILDGEVVRMAD